MAREKKLNVVMATMLVAGNMMGSGVFLLPASLAVVGSISLLGWLVTTAGAMILAVIFAKLGQLDPQEGGPYAYARDFFGPYMGFQTNYVYWFASWIGNIAIAVAAVGYFSTFIPALKVPIASAIANIALIWFFTYANIVGPRLVGQIQSATTSLALIPILGTAIFGWFWFKPDVFVSSWNVSGSSSTSAISSAAAITLWAFIGVESASVSAGVVENPKKNIPIATIGGVALAAIAYILSSTVIMGMIPNDRLQNSAAPFADAARLALGDLGGIIVTLCATLACAGSLGGWTLLVGQSGKAAADDGMFPKVFGKLNRNGVPALGLIVVAILMTMVVFATMSPTAAAQFGTITNLAVILTILPYIYSSVAVWKVCYVNQVSAKTLWTFVVLGIAASLYFLWAVAGSNADTVRDAMIFLLLSVPLYPFFIRSMRAAEQRKQLRLKEEQEVTTAPGWSGGSIAPGSNS